MIKKYGLACVLALAATGPAGAQEVIRETTTVTTQPEAAPQLRRASQILGSSVLLQGGAAYGKVEDIVLNDSGTVEYVLVSNNGRMAMMPWGAGNFDYAKRVVTYEVTPQAVQPLTFTSEEYPRVVNSQYTTRVRQVFPRAVRTQVAPPPGAPLDADKVKIKERRDGSVKVKVKDRD